MRKHSLYTDMKRSERIVSKYLKELGLWWIYESPIFVYDEKGRPRVWTPDFFIPKLGMYIEVCGSKRFNASYEYRQEIFKKNDVPVIFIHFYKERRKWKTYLKKRIVEIEESRHSEIMDIIKTHFH